MRHLASVLAVGFITCIPFPVAAHSVTEASLRTHISVLASDEFEGREPGTAGEKKTIDYIAATWKKAGLVPGASDGTWFDPVSLVRRGVGTAKMRFFANGRELRFVSDEAVLIGDDSHIVANKVPLFFGGYGITRDGKAVEGVAGKAVVILLDRPEKAPAASQSFRARREALVAAGAIAVIAVADSSGAWTAVQRQLQSRPIGLASAVNSETVSGAVSSEFAVGLVTAAGKDWDKLRTAAKSEGYVGESLGITADLDITTDVVRFDSYNVVGKIPGKKKRSGAVLFMGHWDHLGICQPEGEPDRICNGAVDNASGIALLNEVAASIGRARFDRDIYFLATTAEESGLLGAYAFTEKPPMKLDDIVIALNVDTVAIAPKGAKVAVIGQPSEPIAAAIGSVAAKLRRQIETSSDANAFIQRQDGWALSQKNVPAVMIGGAFADIPLLQKFLVSPYHGPKDELTAETILSGAVEDTLLHVELGRYFANSKKYRVNKTGS